MGADGAPRSVWRGGLVVIVTAGKAALGAGVLAAVWFFFIRKRPVAGVESNAPQAMQDAALVLTRAVPARPMALTAAPSVKVANRRKHGRLRGLLGKGASFAAARGRGYLDSQIRAATGGVLSAHDVGV